MLAWEGEACWQEMEIMEIMFTKAKLGDEAQHHIYGLQYWGGVCVLPMQTIPHMLACTNTH